VIGLFIITSSPNVSPASVLAFMYTWLTPVLLFNHVTYTLSPSASILVSNERPVPLVNLTTSSNVSPLSLLIARNASQTPVALVHHVTYALSPDAATGAYTKSEYIGIQSGVKASASCCCCCPIRFVMPMVRIIPMIAPKVPLFISAIYQESGYISNEVFYLPKPANLFQP
jgi:hypothetical protein